METRLVDLLTADCVPNEDKEIIDKKIIGGIDTVTKMSQVGRLYHLQKSNPDFPKGYFELVRQFAFSVVDEKEKKRKEKKREKILAERA